VKPPTVIIDTNVVVSGPLTRDPEAPTRIVLDGMLAGNFPFLLSPELLAEYRSVLLRPKVRRLHGRSEPQIDAILVKIVLNAILREPPESPHSAPDPGDAHLWALLALSPGAILVTGDQPLRRNPPAHRSVLSPRGFLEMLKA
jgi:putative PIN family toxin of toxin-antitoxin system